MGLSRLSAAALVAALGLAAPAAEARTPADALVMAYNIDAISTFDPAQIGEVVTDELLNNICDPLVFQGQIDATQFVPGLAERWEVLNNGRTIRFHLRPNLRHPSGNPVTAQDAAWSMQRTLWLNFGNAAQFTEWGFTAAEAERQFVAASPTMLDINMPDPWPVNLIMHLFAGRQGTVLDRRTIEPHIRPNAQGQPDHGNAWLRNNTACIGPYRLANWRANELVTLERNPGYWRGEPRMRRVIVRHAAESAAQRLMLEKGDVDIARDLNAEDMAAVEASRNLRLVRTTRTLMNYIGANMDHPLLSNQDLRLAMRYLIDYEQLGRTILRHEGKIWQSHVPEGSFGALPEAEGRGTYKLDIARARELIQRSGLPQPITLKVIFGTGSVAPQIVQHFQANARQAGLNIEVEQMTSAQLFARMRGREFELAYLGWQSGYPDANANTMRHVFNPDNRAEARQAMFLSWRASYANEEMNKASDAARRETNPDVRLSMYHAIQRRFMQEGPFFYIFQNYRTLAVTNNLKEITQNQFKVWYTTAVK
jgi:peptide/nickel transport system substrate-binding protein